MISFIIALIVLVAGYLIYGKYVSKVFGIDTNKQTPAIKNPDGIDYIPMPYWKLFLIQFLNIAGLGPIFGAVMGIMYGPSAFLWIVFGTIFAGAVHDFISGMISIRQNGASLTEIVGSQLGKTIKIIMLVFSVFLLILVGAVFVSGPADLLHGLMSIISKTWWIVIVFAYYVSATLLPIDKIIGKIYPVFGFVLLFMAVGILFGIFWNKAPIPEVWDGLGDMHHKGYPIFPMMFVSIACGAISGFHATQSPLVARCIENERYGRRVFYGAMVMEGIVALIWAAAASSFYGGINELQNYTASLPKGSNAAAQVVNDISHGWLGTFGGFLAILGVIAAPITSGDTALRSARLIIADFTRLPQKAMKNRLIISLPIFAITFFLLMINFDILWRYFAWSNQTLSVFTLWACTVYLYKNKKNYFITLLPAMFMTSVSASYLLYSKDCMINMNYWASIIISIIVAFTFLGIFIYTNKKRKTVSIK